MSSTLPGKPSAHPADEAQALRDEIERTRERLGDTVEQLAAKADLKKQARTEAARFAGRVRAAVARARGQAMLTAAKARGTRTQARHKVVRTARAQRGPLAGAVAALAAALAVLIVWKRRRQS